MFAFHNGFIELALAVSVLKKENGQLKERISELDTENEMQAEHNYSLFEGIEKMYAYSVVTCISRL